MHAHHTGTTVLVGSTVASLSALARGSAVDSLGVLDLDADLIAGSATVDLPDAVSRDVEQLAVDSAEVWHVEVACTAAAFAVGAVSMVEAARTVEAVTVAADTGKFQQ
jgi:hypothetical protein